MELVKSFETSLGTIHQSTVFTLNNDSIAIEFQVIVSEYTSMVNDSPAVDSLPLIIQSIVVNEMKLLLKGEIIYENYGDIKGKPCYWFLIRYNSNLVLKCCLIWNRNNLITLMHYSEYDNRLSMKSDRFFNSFMLLSMK